MNKTRLWLSVFLMISVSFLAKGCSFLPKTSLMILAYHLEKRVVDDELTAEIKGAAVNDGGTELQYAEVIGKFYHKDGTLLYSGVASTTTLISPGEIWEFTIPYISAPGEAHLSLKIVSYRLEKNSSGAKIIGQAQNNGDVMLSFAEITGPFYSAGDHEMASATDTTTRLGVGELWEFTIFYPAPNSEDVDYVTVEVTKEESEPAPDVVDHATVEVGMLSGRTIMP